MCVVEKKQEKKKRKKKKKRMGEIERKNNIKNKKWQLRNASTIFSQ